MWDDQKIMCNFPITLYLHMRSESNLHKYDNSPAKFHQNILNGFKIIDD